MGRRLVAPAHRPAVVGGLLAAAAVGESVARIGSGPNAAYLLFALATTVPPIFLGPVAAAVAVSGACLLSLTLVHALTVAGLAVELIVLYRLGHDGPRRESPTRGAAEPLAVALALPFVLVALTSTRAAASEAGVLTVLLASLGPAAAWVGIARRARSAAQVHRAARQVIAEDLIEHTARGERARIARELHDVVAHHISVIAVQAETARLTTPGMPPAGAQRLSEIGDTARAGLTEMRRLLGVLREDAGAAETGAGTFVERRPQPGLGQLNDLLDEARDTSGVGTRLIVSGRPVTLDPGVELAAYRIVQEALTNARRHAPGAAVDVELHYADDVLWLRVRDNGPGPSAADGSDETPDGGHGLLGMRERATAVGGRLRSGAASSGGFMIEAALPAKAEALT